MKGSHACYSAANRADTHPFHEAAAGYFFIQQVLFSESSILYSS